MKYSTVVLFLLFVCKATLAQVQETYPIFPDNGFYNEQMAYDRVRKAVTKYDENWKQLFKSKGLNYPNTNIFIREFKASRELEIWARNTPNDTFTLVRSYPICVLSGKMGPKRRENDMQMPEGLYFIDEFNPKSNYYLSLLVSYPNHSDLVKSDKQRPGNDIYIHGACVTVGCTPMTDEYIQEIYSLCLMARTYNQLYIPVHIFPVRFNRKGLDYLGPFYKENDNQKFWINLKRAYDYFEINKKLLPVIYTQDGDYVF